MADTPTTRNRFRKQEVGAKTNAWGGDLNEDGGSDRLDEALDGVAGFSLSGSKTLSSTNYEADEARMRTINVTGGTGGTVTIPAVEKWYIARNGSSGNLIISNGSNSVTISAGDVTAVFTNGTTIYATNNKTYVDAAILAASLTASLPSQAGNAGKYITTDGTNASWGAVLISTISGLQTALDAKQATDTDLTVISALTPTNNDFLVYTTGAWANRTVAQVKTTLSLNSVDNTSDANKPVSTAAQTAIDLKLDASAASVYGLSLIDDANAAAARTTLGLGTAAVMAGPSGTILGTTDTQTLTNKRITPRIVAAGGTSGSQAPNSDTTDQFELLGLTGSTTIAAPTGTPTDGQKLIIHIEDNGTGRGLTWNAIYLIVGVTLPTTTVANKEIYVGCIYRSSTSKWNVVAVVQEA